MAMITLAVQIYFEIVINDNTIVSGSHIRMVTGVEFLRATIMSRERWLELGVVR